jgi:hypothetical protein
MIFLLFKILFGDLAGFDVRFLSKAMSKFNTINSHGTTNMFVLEITR